MANEVEGINAVEIQEDVDEEATLQVEVKGANKAINQVKDRRH